MATKPAQKIVKSMDIDELAKQMRIDNAMPHYSEEELNEMGSKALRKFMTLNEQEKPNDNETEEHK